MSGPTIEYRNEPDAGLLEGRELDQALGLSLLSPNCLCPKCRNCDPDNSCYCELAEHNADFEPHCNECSLDKEKKTIITECTDYDRKF